MDRDVRTRALTLLEAKQCSNGELMDVLGVVSSLSIDARNDRACLLMIDPSIAVGSCARVTLRGPKSMASLADVSSGDIVQIHGATKQNGSESVLCELKHQWENPTHGPLWTQLSERGRISEAGMRGAHVTTPAERVQDLLNWFSTESPHVNACLPPLPCRRRRLREIQSPGMQSHIVASVLSIDSAWERKSRRRKIKEKTTFATLSDEIDTVIPFRLCCRFKVALEMAMKNGKHVLITNVLSVQANEEETSALSDLVLIPSSATTVAALTSTATPSIRQLEMPCLSLTPYFESAFDQRTVMSPLKDLYVDALGISLGEGKHFLSPTGFATIVIDTKHSPHFRQCTLTLDESIAPDCFVVRAEGSILQTLCGSMEVETLLTDAQLRRYAMEMLRGFLEESTMLLWTLKRVSAGEQYCATSVSLPVL